MNVIAFIVTSVNQLNMTNMIGDTVATYPVLFYLNGPVESERNVGTFEILSKVDRAGYFSQA